MSISIFSVTKGGYVLSQKIATYFETPRLYVSKKVGQAPDYLMDGDMKQCVEKAFKTDRAIIFVMATGIVVRMIAPYLQHKTTDPAIIVLDEKGHHVISLLSGHLGGGNALALDIAEYIGGEAVITTSSDVQDKIAVDVLALRNGLVITSMVDAKNFASVLVNDEALMLVTDGQVKMPLTTQWCRTKKLIAGENSLYISSRKPVLKPTLHLIPKNIVLGIGCRRGVEKERILNAIKEAFEVLNLELKGLKKIATVDVKKDEKGLLEAVEDLAVPLEIIERSAIRGIQNQFKGSDFVEKTIGVRAVCEPVAMLASNKEGRFLMEKTSFDGITIAVWEENYEIR